MFLTVYNYSQYILPLAKAARRFFYAKSDACVAQTSLLKVTFLLEVLHFLFFAVYCNAPDKTRNCHHNQDACGDNVPPTPRKVKSAESKINQNRS